MAADTIDSSRRDRVRRLDAVILRWAFAGLLGATIAVLAFDYYELKQAAAASGNDLPRRADLPTGPLPPNRDGSAPSLPSAPDGTPAVHMSFDLQADGRLVASGGIAPGTADAFAAEIEKRGSYVRTVVLASAGGSVTDALAMGRLIREKGFATEVEAGAYCASSCPLVLAAGTERRVGPGAAVGVHQVFSWTDDPAAARATMADGMDHAQRVSAECQRYLATMGVDPQVWVHAMETPKTELYYFTSDDMIRLKLATATE